MSLSHSPFSTANKPSANCCRTAWVETASGNTGSCAAVLGSGLGTPLNCPYCDNAPYRGVMASFTPCISMVMSSDNTTKLADKETWGRRKVRTAFHSVSARRFCSTACCTDSLFCSAVCNASSKLKDACFCAAKPLIVDTRTSPIPIHLLLTLSLKYFIGLYTCVTLLPVCAASETRLRNSTKIRFDSFSRIVLTLFMPQKSREPTEAERTFPQTLRLCVPEKEIKLYFYRNCSGHHRLHQAKDYEKHDAGTDIPQRAEPF